MIADAHRLAAYRRALRRAVRPGTTVLDRAGRARCRFDPSTFFGQPVTRAALSAKRAAKR